MLKLIIFIILIATVYYAVKSVVVSALRAYHEEEPRKRVTGEDMVLDPECRTYILRDRAVTRRIGGSVFSFCSEACARRYEEAHRG
jgi:YHS domain-containing protein